jgi:hypothetical protein
MNEKQQDEQVKTDNSANKPVDENMGFYFSSSIKIHDPESGEVIVHMRGDN